MQRLVLILSLSLTLGCTHSHNSEEHSHHHETHKEEHLSLNEGKKWKTDKVLRQNMGEIGKITSESISRLDSDDKMETEAFVKKVENNIQTIFKNCKLSVKADQQLHILLITIIEGKELVKNAQSLSKKRDGLEKVQNGYERYKRFFDHTF